MTTLAELPFVTPDDIAHIAYEARIGGNLYREFVAGNLYRTRRMEDVDRYVHDDATSLAEGRSYRYRTSSQPYAWAGGSYPASVSEWNHVMSEPSPARITVERAESMLDWPIYRAAILAPVTERMERLARIAEVYPEAAAEALQA